MIISRTPLRLSFTGGGTDLADYYCRPGRKGAVVSTAINRYIYITVNRKWDDLVRVSYSKTEIVDHADKLEHNIIREALRIVGIDKGIEIVYIADLSLTAAGSGLGSSSALAVGVLNALYAIKGLSVSADRLAREACMIEREILKHPIGKQDQYIAAYGGLNFIQFNADESVFVDPVICRPETKRAIERKLMLFYTGIDRRSSDILTEQQATIGAHLDAHDRLAALAPLLRSRLCENNVEALGAILHEGWQIKTQLASNISNTRIDDWYARARRAGATGGKIAGAGGGGFLLLYCDEDRQAAVREALTELRYDPVMLEPQGSKIIYVSD